MRKLLIACCCILLHSLLAFGQADTGFATRLSSTTVAAGDASNNFKIVVREKIATAPTGALAGAGAGNVENGAHRYKVTFVTAQGETSAGTASSAVTVVDKTTNGKVSLSSIATGSVFVTSRKVYRTLAGGTVYKLLTTIADNTTTTYSDNTADASLTTTAPVSNSTANPFLTYTNSSGTTTVYKLTIGAGGCTNCATGTITGSGSSGQVALFTGASAIGGDTDFTFSGDTGTITKLAIGAGAALTSSGAGGTVATLAGAEVLTNKTIDAEGTGNLITQAFKTWLPAAGCNNATAASFWDLPTSTPAVAACVTGTNTQKGVLQYADTSGGFSAQNAFLLPSDFSGTVDARIIWRTAATTGNAKFSLSTICTAVDATETDDPAFNTASTVTTAAPGTTLRLQTSSITTVTITGCAAGEFMHLKLFRDGNDGSDTLGASLDVIGVEITTRRAQ